jgi:hypothetical protein
MAGDADVRSFVIGAWANHQRDPDGTYRWRKWVFHPDGRTEFFVKSCIPFPRKDCAVEPTGPNEAAVETTWSVRRIADRRFTDARIQAAVLAPDLSPHDHRPEYHAPRGERSEVGGGLSAGRVTLPRAVARRQG